MEIEVTVFTHRRMWRELIEAIDLPYRHADVRCEMDEIIYVLVFDVKSRADDVEVDGIAKRVKNLRGVTTFAVKQRQTA